MSFRSRMPGFASLFPSFHTLEPIALSGEFEVGKKNLLVGAGKFKPAGDLCGLGYPHYRGKVRYQAEVELGKEYLDFYLLLDCGEVRDQVEVLVNGKSAGKKIGPPYQFPIGELVQAGKNSMEFLVSNTAANLLSTAEPWGLLGPVMILPFHKFTKTKADLIPKA